MADKTAENERIYTIPLREVKTSPRNHRSDRAIRFIKTYLSKHMKSDDIWIDASVNEFIWARGMYEVPRRIRVRARLFEDGVVEVSLPDVEAKASIREEIKKRKEKAEEKKEKAEDKKEKTEEKKEEGAEKKEGETPAKKESEAPKKEKASPQEGAGEKPKAPAKTPASESSAKPAPKATEAPKEKSAAPAKTTEGGKEKSA